MSNHYHVHGMKRVQLLSLEENVVPAIGLILRWRGNYPRFGIEDGDTFSITHCSTDGKGERCGDVVISGTLFVSPRGKTPEVSADMVDLFIGTTEPQS
jgi:hypothetical protein